MERPGQVLSEMPLQEVKEEDGTASGVSPPPPPLCLNDVEDMQVEMLEKARELFRLCDKEEKGFITKLDMQRLQSELPLTTEQLEDVFDSLEQDNNGYLTPVEFSMGLGKFTGIEQYQSSGSPRHEETFESGWSDDLDQADEEEKRFCSMLEQLEASQVFEEQSEVQELWVRLRKERPELLASFEEFLFRISSYVRDVHHEKESMELALKRREGDHDREIRCLYEEMEQQIKAERERLLSQESVRHGKSSLLQKELRNKEQEFEAMLYRQKKLEHQLQSQNTEQLEMRVQNERLRLLNENLLDQVERSKWDLEVARAHLQQLQKEAQLEQEKKDRFRSITKQYFRRVDGILIIYDITTESSFTAVRNWITCVQDGIEDGAVIFLLGNKMDVVDKEHLKVPRTEGERLAKEYKAVFYECSARTGYNILEPMLHMARLLTVHEDKQREWELHLEEYSKRKGCCL